MIVCILLSVLSIHVPVSVTHNIPHLDKRLSERIGNFSIELLYHTTTTQNDTNLILAPIMIWQVLATVAETASANTQRELTSLIRVPVKSLSATRHKFQWINRFLIANTSLVESKKINVIFIPEYIQPLRDSVDMADDYDVQIVSVSDPRFTANVMNSITNTLTNGIIPKIINLRDLDNVSMVATSALFLKGKWSVPFNPVNTHKQPFYNNEGKRMGYVNMMNNRYTYPCINIEALQATVIEIPYGLQNRLSMLILLPSNGVSIEQMLHNLATVHFDTLFDELNASKDKNSVNLLIPRFKISSDLDLTESLRNMGINDLFDKDYTRLPLLAARPVYASKILHKADIEVTEDGLSLEEGAEIIAKFNETMTSDPPLIKFEANRPFWYFIIEKITNSICFGGLYKTPTLF